MEHFKYPKRKKRALTASFLAAVLLASVASVPEPRR
jgi:hypothetical protein